MALPTPSLYAAPPSVSVDGNVEPSLGASVLSASVEDDVAGMRRCELVLGNWGEAGQGLGFVHSDRRLVDFGRALATAGARSSAAPSPGSRSTTRRAGCRSWSCWPRTASRTCA